MLSKQSTSRAILDCFNNRVSLAKWNQSGDLQYDRQGYRIKFTDGRWTLYANNMIDRVPVYMSSDLNAAINAARGK